MGKIKITYDIEYSYAVNKESAVVKSPESDIIINAISSDNNITFTLIPENITDLEWYDIVTLNALITNISDQKIENFHIKLHKCSNMSYVSGSLVNTVTGIYYPAINWTKEFCETESIAPGETLNLTYSLKIIPDSSVYITCPFTAYNSTDQAPDQSNISNIYISETNIIASPSSDNMTLYIENTGTIPTDPFTYKFDNPPGTTFSQAQINGAPYTDISCSKFGTKSFFKIGSLPVSSPSSPQILIISFT